MKSALYISQICKVFALIVALAGFTGLCMAAGPQGTIHLAEVSTDRETDQVTAGHLLTRFARNILNRAWDLNYAVKEEMLALADARPTPLNGLSAQYMTAYMLRVRGEIGNAEVILEQILPDIQNLGNEQLLILTSIQLADIYREQGNGERAMEILERLQEEVIFEGYSDLNVLFLRVLAGLYQKKSEYLKALQILLPMAQHFENIPDVPFLPDIYGDLALLFGRINQPDEAIGWHERALKLFYANNDRPGIARTMNNLTTVFEQTGEHERMADSLYVAIEINRAENNLLNLARNYYNLATTYSKRELFETASEHYRTGLELSEQVGSMPGIMFNTYGIGEMLRKKDIEPEAAREMFLASLELARGMSNYGMITNNLSELYELEKSAGNFEAALALHEEYLEMRILFMEHARSAAIQELVIQHNVEQTQNENLLLNQKLSFQEETSRNRLTIIVILVIGLILTGSLFVYALIIKKKLEKAVASINEQRELLRVRNAELERVGTERDAFLQIIVHDLKNPLSVIEGVIELIKQDSYSHNLILLIEKAQKKAQLLILSLLNVFRMDKINVLELVESQQSDEVMAKLREEYELLAQQKDIELILAYDTFSFFTHPESFHGILSNLISNAIKYSPHEKRVWITMKQSQKGFQVTVRDEGPGFSRKDLELIFKPFAKLSARPTGGESSTGIGLYSVKASTDRLNGTVKLEQPEEGGAEFILEFPLNPSHTPKSA